MHITPIQEGVEEEEEEEEEEEKEEEEEEEDWREVNAASLGRGQRKSRQGGKEG